MTILEHFTKKAMDYLRRHAHPSAQYAKERLQIIIAHERIEVGKPDYLVLLQKDLLDVIKKYVPIDPQDVKVELERKEGFAVLELNVTLPTAY